MFERGQKVYTPLVKKRRQRNAWGGKKLIFLKLLVYVEYTIFILRAGKLKAHISTWCLHKRQYRDYRQVPRGAETRRGQDD